MFWPIVLPFQITAGLGCAIVLVGTLLLVRYKKWKPDQALLLLILVSGVGFIPSCMAIQSVLDTQRFGLFEHATYDQVRDARVERYLPPAARQITIEKQLNRNRARYTITEAELTAFLDDLWDKHSEYSAVPRGQLDDGEVVSRRRFAHQFEGLDWPLPESAVTYSTPVESDGGGATYYYDRESGVAYHDGGYW